MQVRKIGIEWKDETTGIVETTGILVNTGKGQRFLVEIQGRLRSFRSIAHFCDFIRQQTGVLPAVGWGPRLLEE